MWLAYLTPLWYHHTMIKKIYIDINNYINNIDDDTYYYFLNKFVLSSITSIIFYSILINRIEDILMPIMYFCFGIISLYTIKVMRTIG